MKSVIINPLAIIPKANTSNLNKEQYSNVPTQPSMEAVRSTEPPHSGTRSKRDTLKMKTLVDMVEEADPQSKASIEREKIRTSRVGCYSYIVRDGDLDWDGI